MTTTQKMAMHSNKQWDRAFAPSSHLAVITTVDSQLRPNAAAIGTCVRLCHDPVCIGFEITQGRDTYHNVLDTGEFVVNLPSFERSQLEKVLIIGGVYDPGIDETKVAGLTTVPGETLRPPRIAEFGRHFECEVQWTHPWENKLMVLGKVVAASCDTDLVDADGFLIWDRAKPVEFAGGAYHGDMVPFAAAYELMYVPCPEPGPHPGSHLKLANPAQA